MKVLLFTINLNKVEKDQLYKTDKGVWLSGAIVIRDEPDKFGNIAFITQKVEQKNREADAPIIGNAKKLEPKEPEQLTQQEQDNLGF